MWVECIERDDSVLDAARRVSDCSADECFSASEVAAALLMNEGNALSELDRLEQMDWVVRDGDDWTTPATADSRWIVRVHTSLTVGKRYEVLGICSDNYRVLDDSNDPVLFDPSCFQVVDNAESEFWTNEWGDEKERYAGPKDWERPGFFEDFYDGEPTAYSKFWNDLRELYPRTWKERRTAS